MRMSDPELERAIEAVQSILQPLRRNEFSEKIGKVSIYVQSAAKSWDAYSKAMQSLGQKSAKDDKAADSILSSFKASLNNSLLFARINLDAALVQALQTLVWRPKNPTKTDESRKAAALKKVFDRSATPGRDMLQHYLSASDPLDKWLVAGPWGHEYLRKRGMDLEDFDRALCEILECGNSPAGKVVLSYTMICKAIDEVEMSALASAKKTRLANLK